MGSRALIDRDASVTTHSPAETRAYSASVAERFAAPGLVIALRGELGAGKTQFAKGFARALGIDEMELTSPTYALANEYHCRLPSGEEVDLYHLDCYRFMKPDELVELGIEDYLSPRGAITLIEWPERIERYLPHPRLEILIESVNETERMITLTEVGP